MEASVRRVVEQKLNRQFYDVKNSGARFRIHQGGLGAVKPMLYVSI